MLLAIAISLLPFYFVALWDWLVFQLGSISVKWFDLVHFLSSLSANYVLYGKVALNFLKPMKLCYCFIQQMSHLLSWQNLNRTYHQFFVANLLIKNIYRSFRFYTPMGLGHFSMISIAFFSYILLLYRWQESRLQLLTKEQPTRRGDLNYTWYWVVCWTPDGLRVIAY